MVCSLQTLLAVWLAIVAIIMISHIPQASAIGCFVCSSINGSNTDCEDTFNNTNPSYYKTLCFTARKGRSGTFPGTECIKMTASLGNYTIVVRDCTVDSGGVNSETELGRESHCWMVGEVRFDGVKMRGCTLACGTNGCNHSNSLHAKRSHFLSLVTWSVVITLLCVFNRTVL